MPVVISGGVLSEQPVDTPHLAYPLQITAQGAVVVEQDTLDEIEACVHLICDTPQGYRADQPTFGIPDPLFASTPMDVQAIADAINALEPRALLTITQGPDVAPGSWDIVIDVAVNGSSE
jgi:phage baseplate assembly protein W